MKNRNIIHKDKIVTITQTCFFANNLEVEFLLFNKYKCNIDYYGKDLRNLDELQDSIIEMIKKDIKELDIN